MKETICTVIMKLNWIWVLPNKKKISKLFNLWPFMVTRSCRFVTDERAPSVFFHPKKWWNPLNLIRLTLNPAMKRKRPSLRLNLPLENKRCLLSVYRKTWYYPECSEGDCWIIGQWLCLNSGSKLLRLFLLQKTTPNPPSVFCTPALQGMSSVMSSANKLYKQRKCRNRYRRNIGAVSGCLLFAKPVVFVSFFSLSTASSFLKQAFEGEYPKLLRLYNELWRRLQQYSTSLQGALTNVGGMDASVDVAGAEMDGQDLFTHGKENYKWADTRAAEGFVGVTYGLNVLKLIFFILAS